jgi:hypothetical protein
LLVPLLQSYLDESSDEKKEHVFCVGAFLANEVHWKEMQGAWLNRLRVPDEIAYFRSTSCKSVNGPFFKLRAKYGSNAHSIANKIRADLEALLLSYSWLGFGIAIVISDYQEVLKTVPIAKRFYKQDPVEMAFGSMFYAIGRAVRAKARKYQVSYIIDDSTYSAKITDVFKAVKINHPVIAKSMATVVPLDDKTTVPLQIDLTGVFCTR